VIDDPADPTALGRVLRRRRARARRPRLGDIIDAQAAVLAGAFQPSRGRALSLSRSEQRLMST
jgi:hypothetical protein